MTSTLANVRDSMSILLGDYLHDTVTTPIAASTSVICSRLNQVGNVDDYFKNWYVLITSLANIGVSRRISAYTATNGTLTVMGANLTTDGANSATFEMHRYDPVEKVRAINEAAFEVFPSLHKRLDIRELVTGNCLPNSHFRDWSLTTVPNKYTLSNATALATTTAGLYYGGGKSMKVTASAAYGRVHITSHDYPRLLDLMGHTVTFKCRANPQVDDDAFIEIFTIQAGIKEGEYTADAGTDATKIVDAELLSSVDDYYNNDYLWNSTRSLGAVITDYDGATKTLTVAIASQTNGDIYHISTTQTLTSTTSCPAGKFTLLELENQSINDNLTEIQFRFKVKTNVKYAYFDNARVTGHTIYEYLLPLDFKEGTLSQVFIQTSSEHADENPCDTLNPEFDEKLWGWGIDDSYTDKHLRLKDLYGTPYLLKLVGYSPLENTISSDTDTGRISIDIEQVTLLATYAAYKLMRIKEAMPASDDISRYERQAMKFYMDYLKLLPSHGMARPTRQAILPMR